LRSLKTMSRNDKHDRGPLVGLPVQIKTNYTRSPDTYITIALWDHIHDHWQQASTYWLRQWLLETLMDIADACNNDRQFDPLTIFPPEDNGEALPHIISLMFGPEYLKAYDELYDIRDMIECYRSRYDERLSRA
jgi:hypothetical protein